jgi:tRNA(Arg) A34 adenosine deaminase TadA
MHTLEIRITNPDWVQDAVDFDRPYPDDDAKVRLAVLLARENVAHDTGGPFGAAVFESGNGRLVGVGTNRVIPLNNSCAHAEMVALMMAQARVGDFSLKGASKSSHELFSSCEPCAMCLGATLWSGVSRVVFAATRADAMRLDFDEGPVFPESYRYLTDRGIRIEQGGARADANAVFDAYVARGGPIYNR